MAKPKRDHADCAYEAAAQALKCLGGRWKILIVKRLLDEGESGFNALQRAIPGVSAKMLAQQLRELEDDGVVRRDERVATAPKTVIYTLSDLGVEAAPLVGALSTWGGRWMAAHTERPPSDKSLN